jgi:lipid A ethanolaminephosphotransferase
MAPREPASPKTGHRAGWSPLALAALASAWIATLGNWPLWRALAALPEMDSVRGVVFIAGFVAMVGLLTLFLLAAFAWPRAVKAAIALFLVSAALGAHFMGSYGVVIDPTMMVNVLQTDPRETRDLLSFRLLLTVLVLAGLPIAWLWRARVARCGFGTQLGRNALAMLVALVVLAALLFALSADLAATMRNHKSLRYLINPVNSYYALGVLAYEAQARPKGPPVPIGAGARQARRLAGGKPPLLLLVTARPRVPTISRSTATSGTPTPHWPGSAWRACAT